jgi:hypothetical protein
VDADGVRRGRQFERICKWLLETTRSTSTRSGVLGCGMSGPAAGRQTPGLTWLSRTVRLACGRSRRRRAAMFEGLRRRRREGRSIRGEQRHAMFLLERRQAAERLTRESFVLRMWLPGSDSLISALRDENGDGGAGDVLRSVTLDPKLEVVVRRDGTGYSYRRNNQIHGPRCLRR